MKREKQTGWWCRRCERNTANMHQKECVCMLAIPASECAAFRKAHWYPVKVDISMSMESANA
jgi:ribosomal protein L37E